MDINLWISVFLAIPLAIVANVFTPKVQVWLEGRGKKRSKKRVAQLQSELDQLGHYHDYPEKFNQYLLGVVIRATFTGSLVGIIAAITYILSRLGRTFVNIEFVYFLVQFSGQFVSMVGAMIIINICSGAIRTMNRMRNYSTVSQQLKAQISESSEC